MSLSEASELSAPGRFSGDLPEALPAWAPALPLWAAGDWLWIDTTPPGGPSCWQSGATTVKQGAKEWPAPGSYHMIVLRIAWTAQSAGAWLARVESWLRPGGLLFLCGSDDAGPILDRPPTANRLRPSEWHVIEQQDSGIWRLRPYNRRVNAWFDRHLSPPYGIRTWLKQMARHWLPHREQIACLPLWREESE